MTARKDGHPPRKACKRCNRHGIRLLGCNPDKIWSKQLKAWDERRFESSPWRKKVLQRKATYYILLNPKTYAKGHTP